MFDGKHKKTQNYPAGSHPADRRLDSRRLSKLFKDKQLRLSDDPAALQLARMLECDPDDRDAQELLWQLIDQKRAEATAADDDFHGYYPPKGRVPGHDFVSFGYMTTGESAGILTGQFCGNIGSIGRTKSGKTSFWIRAFYNNPFLLDTLLFVALTRKPELRHLAMLSGIGHRVTCLVNNEARIALWQGADGVPQHSWDSEVVKIVGQSYQRYSAQRLLSDIKKKMDAEFPAGTHPTLSQTLEAISSHKAHPLSRSGQYKESLLYCLADLAESTDGIFEYSSSDFLECVFSKPGLVIFEYPSLAAEHSSFMAGYLMRWLYCKRLYNDQVNL